MRTRRTRTQCTRALPVALIVGGSCTALAFGAQEPPRAGGASSLDTLTERLDSLERDNAHLRQEVEQLRSQTRQEWLTEERSTEIRALVSDVLADSATRTSFQDAAATAGWDAERGFYLRSADNRFMLQVGGLLQARYLWSRTSNAGFSNTGPGGAAEQMPDNQYGFDLPHSRLVFKGHVFEPGIRYYIRTEFDSFSALQAGGQSVDPQGIAGLNLLDAYVAFDLDNQWTIRFGQFKLPFSRERLVSVQNLLGAGRSSVDQLMGIGRSQGIEISTQGSDLAWTFAFSDGATDNLLAGDSNNSGYFPVGTQPLNSPYWEQQASYGFTTRLEYKLAGDWSEFSEMTSPIGEANGILLGVAGHYQMGSAPNDIPFNGSDLTYFGGGNNERITVTADASFNFGGATLFGALYYSNSETKWSRSTGGNINTASPSLRGTTNLMGVVLQGSMYMSPKWEVFARYEYIDPITQPEFNAFENAAGQPIAPVPTMSPLSIATLGANWYIDGQDLRWSFQVGYSFNEITPVSATVDNGFRALSRATNELVILTQFQMQF
jgi:hypothetical protein